MLAAAILVVLITDYICFVPITAAAAFPVVYGIMKRDAIGAAVLSVVAVVILLKHMENLKRIKKGTELHLSFLWRPLDELNRIKENYLTGNAEDSQLQNKTQ